MIRECESVRKKGSSEKCKKAALDNHTLCGTHARSKKPVLWASLVPPSAVIKFQALFRSWLVRRYLKLCGPGILKRSILANDEDLVSCESKEELYPFEFFSFDEDGKIWWFDFATIWEWCTRNEKPTNPYTKVPLTRDTRVRLRKLWTYRKLRKMYIPPESNIFQERIRNRWNIICQVFEDNGFGEIPPSQFQNMRDIDYQVVCQFVESDLKVSLKKTSPYYTTFQRLLESVIRNRRFMTPIQHILQASHVFVLMMCLPHDPYIHAFTLLSALYRM